ncbi:hypothetical protein F5Y16DRAFT_393141 [Xylariaceae sp. FL0255]|nr:hypothetical protein F5Y16DRAFT_393141 [Xylariaceae sp. FL0255]
MTDSTCTFLNSASEDCPESSPPAAEFLTVLVGEEGIPFSIDKEILRSTTCPVGLDTTQDTCRVMDLRPKVFGLFHAWLHEQLDVSLSGCPKDWIELHLYAATNGIIRLQDDSMDMVQDLFLQEGSLAVPRELVELVFAQGESKVPTLREWCVAMAIRALKEDQCSAKDLASLLQHHSFAQEFSKYLYHVASNPLGIYLFEDPRKRIARDYDKQYLRLPLGFPGCYFHSHGQERCPI